LLLLPIQAVAGGDMYTVTSHVLPQRKPAFNKGPSGTHTANVISDKTREIVVTDEMDIHPAVITEALSGLSVGAGIVDTRHP
jgi:hypothetical protein